MTIAIVPIKSKSERLPGKNFRMFLGRPLYCHVIETLLGAGVAVVVDTDCPGQIDMQHPRLLVRNRRVTGDSMNEVIRSVIEDYDSDVYLQTHVTNPLLPTYVVRQALREIAGYDSLMTVDAIRARCQFSDGRAINHVWGTLSRTQDLEPVYAENSNLFVFTRASFEKHGRVGGRVKYLEMPRWASVDIDTPEDWRHAELIAHGMRAMALERCDE